MDFKECLIVASFCVVILAQMPSSENFELHTSPSVTANVSQDAILPCQVSLQTHPQIISIVQWKKHGDKYFEDIYQFTADTGQEKFGPGYQARASLASKEGVVTGNVSLKLKNIQDHDEGIYRCIITSDNRTAETCTVLHVAGKISLHTSPWFPVSCILLVLTLLLPVGVALYCRYKEKKEESKRKHDEEEQRRHQENEMKRLQSEIQNLKKELEAAEKEIEILNPMK